LFSYASADSRVLSSFPTRRSSDLVQALGEDPRDRGLAHAAGAGEQVGVMHAARIERVGQRPDHVFLAHQFGEPPGAPLAGEDEIRHAPIVPRRAEDCPARMAPPPAPASATAPAFGCGKARPPLEFLPLRAAGRRLSGTCGEVSEWLREHAWKVCKRLNRASGVRIPLSPPD